MAHATQIYQHYIIKIIYLQKMSNTNLTCSKCGKNLSAANVKQGKESGTPYCDDCRNKTKKRRLWLILCLLALLLAGGIALYLLRPKTVVGFEGEMCNDSIAELQIAEPEVPFDIAKLSAAASPSTMPTCDNIESFMQQFASNKAQAETEHSNSIVIPSIKIYFDLNSHELSTKEIQFIETYAEHYLQTNRTAKIQIDAYCCDLGSDNINDKLSLQRAESTKKQLIAAGIDANNIIIQAHGKRDFAKFNYTSKEAYRYAEIKIGTSVE